MFVLVLVCTDWDRYFYNCLCLYWYQVFFVLYDSLIIYIFIVFLTGSCKLIAVWEGLVIFCCWKIWCIFNRCGKSLGVFCYFLEMLLKITSCPVPGVNIRGWVPPHGSDHFPVSSTGRIELNMVSYITPFAVVEVTIF